MWDPGFLTRDPKPAASKGKVLTTGPSESAKHNFYIQSIFQCQKKPPSDTKFDT